MIATATQGPGGTKTFIILVIGVKTLKYVSRHDSLNKMCGSTRMRKKINAHRRGARPNVNIMVQ